MDGQLAIMRQAFRLIPLFLLCFFAEPFFFIIPLYGQPTVVPPGGPPDLMVEFREHCNSAITFQLPLNMPIDPSKTIGWITPRHQEGDYLCWAAVTQMAIAYGSNSAPAQCTQAMNNPLNPSASNCCSMAPLEGSACDHTGWPQFGQSNHHAILGLITQENELKHFICKKKTPVLYTVTYLGGDEEPHMYLVYGYKKTSSGTIVLTIDPYNNPPTKVPFPFDPYFEYQDSDYLFQRPTDPGRDYMDICPNSVLISGSGGASTCPFPP